MMVTSKDQTHLRVCVSGPTDAPTLVCVHGFPDNSSVWDGVVAELSDRYRVVTYDVRGAGQSDRPKATSAYLMERLAEDLRAVIVAVSPGKPVHLLAHDWGAIQTWHALAEGLPAKSFTSISGPDLDHAGAWMRRATWGSRLRQTVSSYYIGVFQFRGIAELLSATGVLKRLIDRDGPVEHADVVHGVKMYRANMVRRLLRPKPRVIDVPVQVIAPTKDRYVSVAMQTSVGDWVSDLRVRTVRAGHWIPQSNPALVARWTAELIEHVEDTARDPAAQPDDRARTTLPDDRRPAVVPAPMPRYDARPIAVVTGAGSGIGRATAALLAAKGNNVIVVDINEDAAKETASLCGGAAYTVDVADGTAMEELAALIEREHGVPSIVVNNAGIGLAGPMLATSVADWERIIGVNIWGVIHGSRVFGAMMADRGTGDSRIVNITSAAAYLPNATLPAYATTKAAVLTLTQCLRAELRPHGIGVIAICPGLVDTNITTTTRFVGVTPEEEQRRQRLSKKLYQRRHFTPERAARVIVRAIRRNTPIATVTIEARVGLWLSRLAPWLVRLGARTDFTPK